MISPDLFDLHSRAALFVAQGRYREAIALSADALRALLATLEVEDVASPNQKLQVSVSLVPLPPLQTRASVETSDCGMFTLFDHALLVGALPNYQMIGALMLFNVGLAYHMIGLQSASKALNLRRAIRHYMMAESLLMNMSSPLHMQPSAMFSLLSVLNNQGHIHEYFFDSPNFDKTLGKMTTLLQGASFHSNDCSPVGQWLVEYRMTVLLGRSSKLALHAPLA